PLTLVVQTRDQREVALLTADARTGATHLLHVEKDAAWVPLDLDLPRWLPDGSGFLMASDRSGQRALELHRADGALERVLVPSEFHALVHLQEDGSRAEVLTAGPISTALLEIVPRGTAPWRRLSRDEAEHACTFSKNGELYV